MKLHLPNLATARYNEAIKQLYLYATARGAKPPQLADFPGLHFALRTAKGRQDIRLWVKAYQSNIANVDNPSRYPVPEESAEPIMRDTCRYLLNALYERLNAPPNE